MSETITSASAKLRSRQLTAIQLVEDCLARIRRFEDRVHAWVLVDEEGARAAAEEMDRETQDGDFRGPLHGIPLGIKDIVDVAGWPTLAGSPIRRGHVAQSDAEIVERLRNAGAIILGKTVTTEFASFDPPPTRNPWNLERTPGGSSSGSCAAVALGMCLGAIGSQTGGSITRPASFCGVCGCKPTYGRVSLEGIVPLAHSMDHPGPIARSVADLAVLLDAIARQDPSDTTLEMPARSEPPRLGLLEGFFHDQASPEVRDSVQRVVQTLRSRGAEVQPAALESDIADVYKRHRRVMAVEAAEYHRPWFPQRRAEYGRWIGALLDEGWNTTAIDYAEALRRQTEFQIEVLVALADADALILPATVTPAPGLESTGDPRFNSLWSYGGLPTVCLPCSLSPDGLPLGFQLVGWPYSEGSLLAVAAWCEQCLNFTPRPPMLDEYHPGSA
jgi:aspartyl-tRNA(Asn)/glutamyl-tRNA(Gln) amidotransferase subunit A